MSHLPLILAMKGAQQGPPMALFFVLL